MTKVNASTNTTDRPISGSHADRMGSAPPLPDHPKLAAGVELVGAMKDGGYEQAQWLVKRDGAFIQVSELLFQVAEQLDGRRTLDEIAAGVTDASEWIVTEEHIRLLLKQKLMPLGIIEDASRLARQRPRRQQGSVGGLTARKSLMPPRVTERVTGVTQYLFAPPILIPILALILGGHIWLYSTSGLGAGLQSILQTPTLLLVALGIIMGSGVVHEFGHASALRYGGGKVGGMGVGLYLFFPAFYTDTTDSYRLSRWGKVRTDLGGFYFHLMLALVLIAAYFVSGWDFLLVAVFLINLDVLYQCIPFVRLDGYWVVADLTGVPDFFSLMAPFLGSFLPADRWRAARLPRLKPWVRWVFLGYMLLTIPMLAIMIGLFMTLGPDLASRAYESLAVQAIVFGDALGAGEVVLAASSAAQMLILGMPLLGIGYMAYRLLVQPTWMLWRRNRRLPAVFVAVLGLLLTYTWIVRL